MRTMIAALLLLACAAPQPAGDPFDPDRVARYRMGALPAIVTENMGQDRTGVVPLPPRKPLPPVVVDLD